MPVTHKTAGPSPAPLLGRLSFVSPQPCRCAPAGSRLLSLERHRAEGQAHGTLNRPRASMNWETGFVLPSRTRTPAAGALVQGRNPAANEQTFQRDQDLFKACHIQNFSGNSNSRLQETVGACHGDAQEPHPALPVRLAWRNRFVTSRLSLVGALRASPRTRVPEQRSRPVRRRGCRRHARMAHRFRATAPRSIRRA